MFNNEKVRKEKKKLELSYYTDGLNCGNLNSCGFWTVRLVKKSGYKRN